MFISVHGISLLGGVVGRAMLAWNQAAAGKRHDMARFSVFCSIFSTRHLSLEYNTEDFSPVVVFSVGL